MITELLLWIVMAYGLCNILVYGAIFNGPRNAIRKWGDSQYFLHGFGKFLIDMLSCMMCSSVWVGFFFGIFLYSPVCNILGVHPYISWFFDGFLASGAVWMVNSIIEWYELNRPSNNQ
jgi:hypothetical protein